MKRKISTAVVGLSVFSFGLFGVNIGDGGVVKAEHGETFAPKLESHGDHGGAPAYTNTHGEGMAPKKESNTDFFAPTLEAHGNTGAPALNVGDTPTPKFEGLEHFPAPKQETHADLSSKLDSRGTGSAPALNIGDTGGAPKQEGHTHFPAPKFEAHGHTGGAPANSEHGTGW
ncbi:hypothetical protein [Bacillus cereus group sp. BfR-BA-01448]|uniref:hypothetical protein n=1 Tax=Bacillus cereus group sp. BfR-BA-01448 TaxID=2920352 RepID=UPI001F5A635D|nr:hypothetical protein [Bacillus cereus group sp. BfR-BA-01448]